jgi:hypothetical protein
MVSELQYYDRACLFLLIRGIVLLTNSVEQMYSIITDSFNNYSGSTVSKSPLSDLYKLFLRILFLFHATVSNFSTTGVICTVQYTEHIVFL